jgi:septal ring factor EnvC (AmiA/AmiB activator)
MLHELVIGILMLVIEFVDKKRGDHIQREIVAVEKKIDNIQDTEEETNKIIKKINQSNFRKKNVSDE